MTVADLFFFQYIYSDNLKTVSKEDKELIIKALQNQELTLNDRQEFFYSFISKYFSEYLNEEEVDYLFKQVVVCDKSKSKLEYDKYDRQINDLLANIDKSSDLLLEDRNKLKHKIIQNLWGSSDRLLDLSIKISNT